MEEKIFKSPFTEAEITEFKRLFNKFCKSEEDKGRCHDCEGCHINDAYDAIFSAHDCGVAFNAHDCGVTETADEDDKIPCLLADVLTLTQNLVNDLGNGFATTLGDRTSPYHTLINKGDGDAMVSLVECKDELSEGFYMVHLINDIDGDNAELYYTEHLDMKELRRLLIDIREEVLRHRTVVTNIGEMPVEDFLEMKARQFGYDSYAEMRNDDNHIDLTGLTIY